MPLASYEDLLGAVIGHMHRADVAALAPDFVALGEARLNREIVHYRMEGVASLTLSPGSRSVALPADFGEVIQLVGATASPHLGGLDDVPSAIEATVTGNPSLYRISGDSMLFDAYADYAYLFSLAYRRRLRLGTPTGGAAMTTNWLLTDHPDLYLYVSLAEACRYVANEARAQMYDAAASAQIYRVNASGGRAQGRPPLRSDMAGGGGFNIMTG